MQHADSVSESTARWDRAYQDGSYREHWDMSGPAPDLVGFVAAGTLPPGCVVLDLGCGSGSNAIFLAGLGFRAIGVDLSAAALEIAARRAVEAAVTVAWRRGSVLDLPVETGSVTFAYDRGCLHHIAPEDWQRYAAEAYRVLEFGGLLLLHEGRESGNGATYAVDERSVAAAFGPAGFDVGPAMAFTSYSDAGSMPANLMLLARG